MITTSALVAAGITTSALVAAGPCGVPPVPGRIVGGNQGTAAAVTVAPCRVTMPGPVA